MPRVAVVYTGGTIGMRRTPEGVLPAASGAELLGLVSRDSPIQDVRIVEWGSLPSMHLSFADVFGIASTIRRELADAQTIGAVVVQGTDTIEETSFALDLLLDAPKPVVITGAMRNLDDRDYDGAANIHDAIAAAASAELRDFGVVVAMHGVLHAADDALKVASSGVDAFASPHSGRLGTVVDGNHVILDRRRGVRRHVATDRAALPIPLVTAVLEGDGFEVRAALAAGAVGIVVAAASVGQTRPALLRECEAAMAGGVPVVLGSRCIAGMPEPIYGYAGGGIEWERSGAILAGPLAPTKARVALALGLGANLDQKGLAALFA